MDKQKIRPWMVGLSRNNLFKNHLYWPKKLTTMCNVDCQPPFWDGPHKACDRMSDGNTGYDPTHYCAYSIHYF